MIKKTIISILILFGLSLFVVMNYSIKSTTAYECNGSFDEKSPLKGSKIYVKVVEYRWWVHLWSDDDGDMTYEVPNQTYGYVDAIKVVGNQLQMYQNKTDLIGHLSTLSGYLSLKIGRSFFDGTCKIIS